jgi:hypothetical protein
LLACEVVSLAFRVPKKVLYQFFYKNTKYDLKLGLGITRICTFSGCLIYGYGIGRGANVNEHPTTTDSADLCQSMCQKEAKCNFVTWNDRKCFMKSAVPYVCKHTHDTVSMVKGRCADEFEKKRRLTLEKKRIADVLEKNIRLADEQEMKRLADEQEKKRLADELEKKRLVDEDEDKDDTSVTAPKYWIWIIIGAAALLVVTAIVIQCNRKIRQRRLAEQESNGGIVRLQCCQ